MGSCTLPHRVEVRIKSFVGTEERLQYFLEFMEQQEEKPAQWIAELCEPTYEEVVAGLEDASGVYTSPSFIRLLYRDKTYQDVRDRHLCLVDALESPRPRQVLEELFKHLDAFTAEDRARSFLLLASEVPPSKVDDREDAERVGWLNRIAESFESSPRALRPQLLLAASIIGHQPMATLLLRDIAADDALALNIDAVEAECLIEAAMNQHFSIVKELLDGGRFSNGNESRWDAVVKALEVSCANGSAEIADILLPQYLSYCAVIASCGAHHPRLLRLALSNGRFEIVQLLLECDPRGALCNIMELVGTLREELASASKDATASGFLAIVVGEDEEDTGDVVDMWDAAALARGVSSGNPALVRFLVTHVDFGPAALTAALETAQENRTLDVVQVIAAKLKRRDEEEALDETPKERDQQVQMDEDQRGLDAVVDSSTDEDEEGIESEGAPDGIRPQSATGLEALRRTSFGVVEQAISTARESVALMTAKRPEDEVEQENADKDATDEKHAAAGPPQPRDPANVALLHAFSGKVVGQILREAQVAATQQKTEVQAEAAAVLPDTFPTSTTHSMGEDVNEPFEVGTTSAIADGEAPMPQLEIESCLGDCEAQDEKEEATQAVVDAAALPVESLSRAKDGSPVSLFGWVKATEKADLREPSDSPGDNTAEANAGRDHSQQEHATPLDSATLPLSRCATDQRGDNDALRREDSVDQKTSTQTGSAQVSEPERRVKTSCSVDPRVSQPPRVTSPVSSPCASPNRSTIICPVKWVEHTTEAPEHAERVLDSCGPLREGDCVEVHYKGRSVLFPGVIAFCHADGTYDVVYEDGDEESCVPRDLIQLAKASPSELLQASQDGGEAYQDVEPVDVPKAGEDSVDNGSSASLRDGHDKKHCSNSTTVSSCSLHTDDAAQATRSTEMLPATKTLSEALLEGVPVSDSTRSPLAEGTRGRERSQNALGLDYRTRSGEFYPTLAASVDPPTDTESPLHHDDATVSVELLPEIPSIAAPSTALEISPGPKEPINEVRLATGTSQRTSRERPASVTSQRSRCRMSDNVSAQELAEWKNVDVLLNRKRRLLQSQTGNVESIKVPWGEEFATIQSLKRFATQHPDILRAHIETQLRELDGPLSSPGKPRSPRTRNASSHSGAAEARGSLLLMKDLAFLLQHRLAPFFDAIVPVVMPTVFSAEKRFLCETAAEVMDAILLHCSGRKLVLLLLQLGQVYSKYDDLRLYNLTYVYVEKSVHNWSKAEFASLQSSQSPTPLLTLLANALSSKSAPVRIAVQKSFRHLHDELGTPAFKSLLRAHVPSDLEALVLKECGDRSLVPANSTTRKNSTRSEGRRSERHTNGPTIAQSSPSILQRMLLHRKNRVLPTQT